MAYCGQTTYIRYIDHLLSGITKHRDTQDGLIPAIQEFKDFIETDPVVFTDFIRMLDGATEPLKNHNELILMLNEIFREAPAFGSLGPPVYMIMAQNMDTQDSRNVLNTNEGGWFRTAAKIAMMEEYDGATFKEVFLCDPSAPYYGFTSYEDFFDRRFRNPQVNRPTGPIDDLRLISSACESTSYAYQINVQRGDRPFIKDEACSLAHLLSNDPYTDEFVGGSVLQGFLNTTGYHRWHSPVNGHIKKIVPGTFFANTTARQLIFIEADNSNLGLVCFTAIGMTEISTCQATVYEGQHAVRGDELGMFRFGGSSSALVFRASVDVKVDQAAIVPGTALRINNPIAVVESQSKSTRTIRSPFISP